MVSFPVDELPRPLAVVCHDAGAANIILHGLKSARAGEVRVLAAGPARRIADGLGIACVEGDLDAAMQGAAALLSGTGWSSDLEHRARAAARAAGMISVAVIDHWVNYRERFERDGATVLPDRFWVTDRFALAEAHRHFDANRVDLVDNAYIADQMSRIAPVAADTDNVLLYVLEPARSTWGKDVQGEFQALDYLAAQLPALRLPRDLTIALRPHPSEPPGKYDAWIAAHADLRTSLDTAPDMAGAISTARWVAGCESFGLALALDAGRTVFCTMPPNAPACRLPHDTIVHLRALE